MALVSDASARSMATPVTRPMMVASADTYVLSSSFRLLGWNEYQPAIVHLRPTADVKVAGLERAARNRWLQVLIERDWLMHHLSLL
jgi:hypothetical protein